MKKSKWLFLIFISLFLVSCSNEDYNKEITPSLQVEEAKIIENTFEHHFLETKQYTIKIIDTSIYPSDKKTESWIVFTYDFTNTSPTRKQPNSCFKKIFSVSQEAGPEMVELESLQISNQESPFYKLEQLNQKKVNKGKTVTTTIIYRLQDPTALIFLKAFDPDDYSELGFETFTPLIETKNQQNQPIK
ncbi:DUF5067 domain-containing protein [Vagococcus sp.]|uniref:DUF5067 domain-containing protein n=1 Tax=Vagococcus sp. TaxID=1933889 RepID=UPI003F97473F